MDRGALWAQEPCGLAQSQTQLKRLSMHACIGEGNGNPLQYSCLGNPRGGGAWCGLPSMGLHRVGHSWSILAVAGRSREICYKVSEKPVSIVSKANDSLRLILGAGRMVSQDTTLSTSPLSSKGFTGRLALSFTLLSFPPLEVDWRCGLLVKGERRCLHFQSSWFHLIIHPIQWGR